jgi:hypothetical protein
VGRELLYRTAIGPKGQGYYLEKFSLLERRLYHRASWNWSAAIFGPFWIAHRRIGYHYSFILTFIVAFSTYWGWEQTGGGAAIALGLVSYIVLFPVAANILYFSVVKEYCAKTKDESSSEMVALVRDRFETVPDKVSRSRASR